METLTTIISILLFLGLLSVPILLFVGIKKGNFPKIKFSTYLTSGLVITAGMTLIFAWWADFSDQILLTHYGYEFEAMNQTERFRKVTNENMEQVKQLEIGYYGIGWPLKAIITFILYLPYMLIVYLMGHLIRKRINS